MTAHDQRRAPVDGERRRARDLISTLRSALEAVEQSLDDRLPTTSDRQTLTMTVGSLVERLAVIDALSRAEAAR